MSAPSSHRQAWEIAIFEVEQHGNCPHGADEPAPTEPCVYWAGYVSNGTEGFEVVGPGRVARPCQLFVDSVVEITEEESEKHAQEEMCKESCAQEEMCKETCTFCKESCAQEEMCKESCNDWVHSTPCPPWGCNKYCWFRDENNCKTSRDSDGQWDCRDYESLCPDPIFFTTCYEWLRNFPCPPVPCAEYCSNMLMERCHQGLCS